MPGSKPSEEALIDRIFWLLLAGPMSQSDLLHKIVSYGCNKERLILIAEEYAEDNTIVRVGKAKPGRENLGHLSDQDRSWFYFIPQEVRTFPLYSDPPDYVTEALDLAENSYWVNGKITLIHNRAS